MKGLSIILPAFNEEENLSPLVKEIKKELRKLNKRKWEIVVVDDGSRDRTSLLVERLSKSDKRIKLVSFRKHEGKALALQAGFDNALYEVVITMDSDGQDDPKEFGKFLEKIEEGFDLVSGWKKRRKDSFVKNETSKFYNYFTSLLMKQKLHDSNCGFKAYRGEVVKSLHLYGELHRYIPALVEANGFSISEIEVNHRKRKFGESKYGPDRFIKGGLDLITVMFITRYKYRPLHMFGYLGLTFCFIGLILGVYLSWLRLVGDEKIGDRPLLFLAILFMVIGVQIMMTGLIGELITATLGKETTRYQVKKAIL